MATNWPNSVQTFTNPTSGSALNSPSHADQHATVNDTVEALQNYAGLVLVKSVTIGSGVSSVTVSDAFDSRFDNYRIMAYCNSGSTSATGLLRLGSTTTGYYWGHINIDFSNTISGTSGANDSEWEEVTVSRVNGFSMMLDLFSPYLSNQTTFVSSGSDMISSGAPLRHSMGWLDNTTSYTSFVLYPRFGTISGGTIRVYGYNNGA